MAAEEETLPENAQGYFYSWAGISNQKLALFGLFLKALREGPRRIVLPHFLVFDQVRRAHRLVPLETVMRADTLRDFATRQGIEVLDLSPRGEKGNWDYFHYGCDYLPYASLTGELGVDSFPCQFFRALVPVMRDSELFRGLANDVFRRHDIRAVAALRIESDWARHCTNKLAWKAGPGEDNALSFREILTKIMRSISNDHRGIYVTSDEPALPARKDEIRGIARKEFGIELSWKSDFLSPQDVQSLSPLDLSLIDFEIAVAAERFVGISRSTFSKLVSFEKYARTRAHVQSHFIYNVVGPGLAIRKDNGAHQIPQLAAANDVHDRAFGFDLAQIYLCVGEKRKALQHYTECAESGEQPDEQVFVSLYRSAQLKADLEFPASEVIATFLRAANLAPSRAEALHGASRYCRENRQFQQGYEIGRRAIDLAAPTKGLFVEHWIYDYGALDEFAANAYYAGQPKDSLEALLLALERGRVPGEHRPRILKSARHALDSLDYSLPSVVAAAGRLRNLEQSGTEAR